MSAAEPPNFFGSSAAMCADRGTLTHDERLALARGRSTKSKRGPTAPHNFTAGDAFTGCERCGMRGQHGDPGECIAALRDRLAMVTAR